MPWPSLERLKSCGNSIRTTSFHQKSRFKSDRQTVTVRKVFVSKLPKLLFVVSCLHPDIEEFRQLLKTLPLFNQLNLDTNTVSEI